MKKIFLMLFMATTIFIGCSKDKNENTQDLSSRTETKDKNPLANTSWSWESEQEFEDGVLINDNVYPEEIECKKKSTFSFTDTKANSKNWEYNNNTKGCVLRKEDSVLYTVSGDVITLKEEEPEIYKFSINGDNLQFIYEYEEQGTKYKVIYTYKRIK